MRQTCVKEGKEISLIFYIILLFFIYKVCSVEVESGLGLVSIGFDFWRL